MNIELDAVNNEILEERAKEIGWSSEELLDYYIDITSGNFEDDLDDIIRENNLGGEE